MISSRLLIVLGGASLALVFGAAACSSGDDNGTAPTSGRTALNAASETPGGSASPLPTTQACADAAACEAQSRDIAQRDLAAQLGVAIKDVTVVSTQAVDWPDTCLGVSKPGTACAQVITPGYKVVLENAGKQYEYHTDKGTRAILVKDTTPQATPA